MEKVNKKSQIKWTDVNDLVVPTPETQIFIIANGNKWLSKTRGQMESSYIRKMGEKEKKMCKIMVDTRNT